MGHAAGVEKRALPMLCRAIASPVGRCDRRRDVGAIVRGSGDRRDREGIASL
jgi:hypothetical protein